MQLPLNLGGPGWFKDIFTVSIELDANHRTDTAPTEGGEAPIVLRPEVLTGTVRISGPPGFTTRHGRIILTVEQILVHYEYVRTVDLYTNKTELSPPGKIIGELVLPFEIASPPNRLTDSYEGETFGIRHNVLVTVERPWWTFDVIQFVPFVTQRLITPQQALLERLRADLDPSLREDVAAMRHSQPGLQTELADNFSDYLLEDIRPLRILSQEFVGRGGALCLLPTDGSVKFSLRRYDWLFPVCRSGMLLSQVLRQMLIEHLVRIDAAAGTDEVSESWFEGNILLPHGALDGCDVVIKGDIESEADRRAAIVDVATAKAEDSEFVEAFGSQKDPRFGDLEFLSRQASNVTKLHDLREFFNAVYYGTEIKNTPSVAAGTVFQREEVHLPSEAAHRRVYLAFSGAVHAVIARLVETNKLLTNVWVVVIPMEESDLVASGTSDDPESATAMVAAYEIMSGLFSIDYGSSPQAAEDPSAYLPDAHVGAPKTDDQYYVMADPSQPTPGSEAPPDATPGIDDVKVPDETPFDMDAGADFEQPADAGHEETKHDGPMINTAAVGAVGADAAAGGSGTPVGHTSVGTPVAASTGSAPGSPVAGAPTETALVEAAHGGLDRPRLSISVPEDLQELATFPGAEDWFHTGLITVADCGGVVTFDYDKSVFSCNEILSGRIILHKLSHPVVYVQVSLYKQEETDEVAEAILCENVVLDTRLDNDENRPIVDSGLLTVDMDLGAVPNIGPTIQTFAPSGDLVAVRYWVRLIVSTGWEANKRFWNSREILIVREGVTSLLRSPLHV